MNFINNKSMPCYNIYTTSIVAPDGSTKDFCPNHVRAEVKAYKLEIKKKEIEDKLLKKQKVLADKAAEKEAKALKKQKILEEKEAKSETKKSETKKPKVVKTDIVCVSCVAVLKTGSRKGEACGQNAGENNLCKRHQPK